jgi:rod shape determining protein RodA
MRSLDARIVVPVLLLSAIGLLAVFSGQQGVSGGVSFGSRQIAWVVIGVVLCLVLAATPMRVHEGLSVLYYVGFVGSLVVLATVSRGGGVARWFSIGPLSVQPSEAGKIILVIALARYLAYRRDRPRRLRSMLVPGLITLVPFILVVRQPDLGTAVVYLVAAAVVLYWTGVPAYVFLLAATPFVSMAAAFHWISWLIFAVLLVVFLAFMRPGFGRTVFVLVVNVAVGIATPIIWNGLHDYQRLRVLAFLSPGLDPRGAGYQIIQSKIAIGSGGLLGKGYLLGTQTKLAFLPEQHTDFVFSVIGEEFGLLGALVVLVLFLYLISRGFQVAARSRNNFSSLVAAGVAGVLAFQFVVNVGMTLGLLPVTGLPLPFLSYGGLSTLMAFACVGLLLRVSGTWKDY